MQKINQSSRRSFLEKIAAGSIGVALSAGFGAKVLAEKNTNALSLKSGDSNDFISDKKFVPVMITPYKQNGQIDY